MKKSLIIKYVKVMSEMFSRITRIILTIAKEEKSLELVRQVLSQLPKFEPYVAFQRISKGHDGYITREGLKQFLTYFYSTILETME